MQTGKRTLGHAVNELFPMESGDVQVGEFVFDEVDIADTIMGHITADGFIESFLSLKTHTRFVFR